jgi:hypothetical protein
MATMAKRGRKPDLKRRKETRDLRRQGLTIGQIAAELGITPQAEMLGEQARVVVAVSEFLDRECCPPSLGKREAIIRRLT